MSMLSFCKENGQKRWTNKIVLSPQALLEQRRRESATTRSPTASGSNVKRRCSIAGRRTSCGNRWRWRVPSWNRSPPLFWRGYSRSYPT
ncbi:uncharacterized protein TNCV_794301 [Trichonephila clavipes]|nr:uncharacterized protein TNCV_794301 [Trichonephila clavipes]